MQTRVEETLKRHDRGFNCAQSVACTYCDLVGVDEEMMFRVTEAFGAGMGGMEGTCGAISGAIFLAGFASSNGNMDEDPKNKSKADTYKVAKSIMEEFKESHGSCLCKDLKVPDSQYFTPCKKCIEDAALLVEKYLVKDKM